MKFIRQRKPSGQKKFVRPRREVQRLNVPLVKDQIEQVLNGVYSLQKDGVSQSLLSNAICPIKLCLKLTLWTTPDRGKISYYGNIVHYVLERVYSPNRSKTKMPNDSQIINWVQEYIDKNVEDLRLWTNSNEELVAGMAEVVLTAYCQFYKDDFQNKDFVSIESKFQVNFENALLRGMRDGLFEYKKAKGLWILENKTMGKVVEKVLLQRLPIDKQNLFYTTATEIEMLNTEISGVLFNVIRRPQLKYTSSQSVKDYCDRLREDIAKRPEFYFLRFPVSYTKHDKLVYRDNLKMKLLDFEDLLKGKKRIYKVEDACESSYNGSPFLCEYIEACTTGKLRGFIQQKSLFPELEE